MQCAGWLNCVYAWYPGSLGSAVAVLLPGEPITKPCCVRKVTRFGELGGLGNSNGGMVWRERHKGEQRGSRGWFKLFCSLFCSVYLKRIKHRQTHTHTFFHTNPNTLLPDPGRRAQDRGKGAALHQFTKSGGRMQGANSHQACRRGHHRVRVLFTNLVSATTTGALQQTGSTVESCA